MKQINNFINNANLYLVFLISLIVYTILGFLVFISLGCLSDTNEISIKDCLLMCLFIGLLCSLYSTLLISTSTNRQRYDN